MCIYIYIYIYIFVVSVCVHECVRVYMHERVCGVIFLPTSKYLEDVVTPATVHDALIPSDSVSGLLRHQIVHGANECYRLKFHRRVLCNSFDWYIANSYGVSSNIHTWAMQFLT